MKSEIESRGQLKVNLEPVKVQKNVPSASDQSSSDTAKLKSDPASGKKAYESAAQKGPVPESSVQSAENKSTFKCGHCDRKFSSMPDQMAHEIVAHSFKKKPGINMDPVVTLTDIKNCDKPSEVTDLKKNLKPPLQLAQENESKRPELKLTLKVKNVAKNVDNPEEKRNQKHQLKDSKPFHPITEAKVAALKDVEKPMDKPNAKNDIENTPLPAMETKPLSKISKPGTSTDVALKIKELFGKDKNSENEGKSSAKEEIKEWADLLVEEESEEIQVSFEGPRFDQTNELNEVEAIEEQTSVPFVKQKRGRPPKGTFKPVKYIDTEKIGDVLKHKCKICNEFESTTRSEVLKHIKEHKKSERLERGRKKPGPKSKAGIVTETFYFVLFFHGKIPCTHTF